MNTVVFASIAFVATTASSAFAGLVNPLIAPWAGSGAAQFAQWDSFTSAFGGANLPDTAGSRPFSLMNFSPDAFITGAGNIYGPSSPLAIMIMGGTSAGQTPSQVVMNVATLGNPIPPTGVRLSLFDNMGNSISLAPASTEVRSDAPVPPQGSARTVAYTWNTASMPFAATGFRIDINGAPSNMSLDAVRLDLNFVPAPGAFAIMAVAAMGSRRRRA
jgi:hypothetical protein